MDKKPWQDEFRAYLELQGRSRNTVNAYCSDVHLYATWFAALNHQSFKPCLLNAPDLREYRTHSINQQRISATTWNRRRASLKVFAMWAAQNGWVQGDPLLGVLPMKIEEPLPKALTAEEFRRLRRQMDIEVNTAQTAFGRTQAIRDRAMMALMLYALLRSGEIVKLHVDDLTLAEKSGQVQVRCGKGSKAASVPIGLEARTALRAWLEIHPGTQHLFPVSQRHVERLVKQIGSVCGIDLWPHRLRHTGIDRLIYEKGEQIPIVQKLARHKRADTTLRYAIAREEQLVAAAESL